MCSKYENHSRFNGQYNWDELYDHLMSTRIFTLIMNKMVYTSSKFMRIYSGYGFNLDSLTISYNCFVSLRSGLR